MIGIFCFVLAILAPPFKSKSRLEAENAVLGHQLVVLRRKTHGRPRLTNNDRWLFILMYRWCPAILQALTIIRPEMLVRWHRGRLSSLLALEVAPTGRAAADRSRTARGDPANEHGEPSVGSAARPRRVAQARLCSRSIQRSEIHGQTTRTTRPGMADFSS